MIRYHLTHPEPESGGRIPDPMIRIEIKCPVGDSLAYGAFLMSIAEAKRSGLLDYEPQDDGFVHRSTGLKSKTLQMDAPIMIFQVSPAEGKSYFTITEVGYEVAPRFKSWGNYSKRTERPKTGSDFSSLLARARGAADEPNEPDEPEPTEPAPEPAPVKRRRVAI